MKWFKKNNLDEMQEQKLLKIESRGFWLTFWGLLIAMAVQRLTLEPDAGKTAITGEFVVFMVMCLYAMFACYRAGIWDRHLAPTPAVNLTASLIASLLTAAFTGIMSYKNYQSVGGAVATAFISFIFIFFLLFVTLTLATSMHKRKLEQLEAETENDAEESE